MVAGVLVWLYKRSGHHSKQVVTGLLGAVLHDALLLVTAPDVCLHIPMLLVRAAPVVRGAQVLHCTPESCVCCV